MSLLNVEKDKIERRKIQNTLQSLHLTEYFENAAATFLVAEKLDAFCEFLSFFHPQDKHF